MPNTWENGGHVDHNPIVEARAAHLMGHQRRVARSAVAIQTGCRAACREQTAADVLEARKALLLFLSVRRGVYEKGPVRSLSVFAQAAEQRRFIIGSERNQFPRVLVRLGTDLHSSGAAVRSRLWRAGAG